MVFCCKNKVGVLCSIITKIQIKVNVDNSFFLLYIGHKHEPKTCCASFAEELLLSLLQAACDDFHFEVALTNKFVWTKILKLLPKELTLYHLPSNMRSPVDEVGLTLLQFNLQLVILFSKRFTVFYMLEEFCCLNEVKQV